MTADVTEFPKREIPDLLIGPFVDTYKVMVEGRIIPRLSGFHDGDKIALVVDGRWMHSFNKDDAYGAAHLIAQAMAVAEGYPHMGALTKEQPFAPLGSQIDGVPK